MKKVNKMKESINRREFLFSLLATCIIVSKKIEIVSKSEDAQYYWILDKLDR
jgi:hypothetical protein